MEETACQASCRLVTKKRLEVRSEWERRRCLTCLSAAYQTWSSASHPIHNPSCNQIIEGISVRFLTSSRKSCMKNDLNGFCKKSVDFWQELLPSVSPFFRQVPPIQSLKLVPEADGFRCLDGFGYAATGAKPLLDRFLSPSLVALCRDDECK